LSPSVRLSPSPSPREWRFLPDSSVLFFRFSLFFLESDWSVVGLTGGRIQLSEEEEAGSSPWIDKVPEDFFSFPGYAPM